MLTLQTLQFSILSLAAAFVTAASNPLELRLTSGTFLGQTVSNTTDTWLGIPFAKPPIGALRFKAPAAITQPASGVQNAFSFGSSCPQPSSGGTQSEDCLFLNVSEIVDCTFFLFKADCDIGISSSRYSKRCKASGLSLVLCEYRFLHVSPLSLPYTNGPYREVHSCRGTIIIYTLPFNE